MKRVPLPTPLAPHDSVRLSIDWHYEISKQSNREGAIDPTTYFLAYFYPRVAVYDDYNGWDTMTFTDQQEFYSDFNDYDVTVRVPANFIVWGTGTLLNAVEVLQPDVASQVPGVAHLRLDDAHRDAAGPGRQDDHAPVADQRVALHRRRRARRDASA